MRATKSYDKISFKNNIATEEFVITILRDETIEGIIEGVKLGNDLVKDSFYPVNAQNDPVKLKNDLVNDTINPINDPIKSKNDTINPSNDTINDTITPPNDTINFEDEGIKTVFEGINEGIREDLLAIYLYIKKNNLVKHTDIKQIINKSGITIKRYLKELKDKGLIKYVGSKKTGGYQIVTKNQ